jgi:hypothetical protein
MAPFRRIIWEEDLRAPTRDAIGQIFYIAVAALLQLIGKALDLVGMASWLQILIHWVFDGLLVVALINLAIPMAFRMIRSIVASVWKR